MAQIIFSLDNSCYVSWLFHSSCNTFYLWKSTVPASIHYKTCSQFYLFHSHQIKQPTPPISLSLSSSSCRWDESKPAGPSPRAADQLGNLLPSCSTAASLTGPAPSSSQMVLGGLSSCAMPGMLQAPPHQLLRLKGPVQCSVTHFENVQGKERAEHICIMCVNVEPVKAQHKSQDRLTDTGFSPYWASSRLPLHTYQTNLNEHSIKRKRKKVFELSSW